MVPAQFSFQLVYPLLFFKTASGMKKFNLSIVLLSMKFKSNSQFLTVSVKLK